MSPEEIERLGKEFVKELLDGWQSPDEMSESHLDMVEAGFTGEKKDKLGRRLCYNDGKRVPCGKQTTSSGQEPTNADDEKPTVDGAINRIKELAKGGFSKDKAVLLARELMGLTVSQLNELKKRLNVRASGVKADLATKLAERALENATKVGSSDTLPATSNSAGEIDYQQTNPDHPIAKAIREDTENAAIVQTLVKMHKEMNATSYGKDVAILEKNERDWDAYQAETDPKKKSKLRAAWNAGFEEALLAKDRVKKQRAKIRERLVSILQTNNSAKFTVKYHDGYTSKTDGRVIIPPFKPDAKLDKHIEEGVGFVKAITSGKGLDGELTFASSLTGRASFSDMKRETPSKIRWLRLSGVKDVYHSPRITLSSVDETHTIIHELGHYIEELKPGVSKKVRAFLEYRLAGETPVDMATVPGGAIMAGEMVRKDHFDRHFKGTSAYYVGKEYKNKAGELYGTEILSMGIEALYTDPLSFVTKDPEYAQFVISMLRE